MQGLRIELDGYRENLNKRRRHNPARLGGQEPSTSSELNNLSSLGPAGRCGEYTANPSEHSFHRIPEEILD